MTLRMVAIDGSDPGLRTALAEADLPVEDLEDGGRSFFRAVGADGRTVGYTGIEHGDSAAPLRSVVVLPEVKGSARPSLMPRFEHSSRACRLIWPPLARYLSS
jgi:hypothetical protein